MQLCIDTLLVIRNTNDHCYLYNITRAYIDILLAMRKKTDGSASNSSGAEQSTRVELKDGATSHRPVEQQQQCEVSPPGGDGEQRQKSAIRTFFVVAALSFHSVVAGLSLSVEKETGGVWLNFAVICMHKFVIAFSMGAELVTATVSIQHPSLHINCSRRECSQQKILEVR